MHQIETSIDLPNNFEFTDEFKKGFDLMENSKITFFLLQAAVVNLHY